jgi:hypothetical protein
LDRNYHLITAIITSSPQSSPITAIITSSPHHQITKGIENEKGIADRFKVSVMYADTTVKLEKSLKDFFDFYNNHLTKPERKELDTITKVEKEKDPATRQRLLNTCGLHMRHVVRVSVCE